MPSDELARILAGTQEPFSMGSAASSAFRGSTSGRTGSFARPVFNPAARNPLDPIDIEIIEPPPRNAGDLMLRSVRRLGDAMRGAQERSERASSSQAADEALRQFYRTAPLP